MKQIIFNALTKETLVVDIPDIEQPTPQPTKPTIDELKQQLADTDYKIIKCYEYQMAGLELPYDIQALHIERQAIRDKIAELEGK